MIIDRYQFTFLPHACKNDDSQANGAPGRGGKEIPYLPPGLVSGTSATSHIKAIPKTSNWSDVEPAQRVALSSARSFLNSSKCGLGPAPADSPREFCLAKAKRRARPKSEFKLLWIMQRALGSALSQSQRARV